MTKNQESSSDAKEVIPKYEGYGFVGGVGLGLIVGVMVAGPSFYIWPFSNTVWTIIGSVVCGGVLGFVADAIAVGSQASVGAGALWSGDDSGHHQGHHSGDCLDGSGGGDGGHSGSC